MDSRARALARMTVAAMLMALALTGCSSGGTTAVHQVDDRSGAPRADSPDGGPVPLERIGLLPPGDYEAELGGGLLRFSVDPEGWRMWSHRSDSVLRLAGPANPDGGGQSVYVVRLVDGAVPLDPMAGLWYTEPDNFGQVPDDLAGWFVALPYVQPILVEPVDVGGVAGTRVVAHIGDLPSDNPAGCAWKGLDCLLWTLFGADYRSAAELYEGSAVEHVFLDTEPWPIVFVATALDPDASPEGQLEYLEPGRAIVESMVFDEPVG